MEILERLCERVNTVDAKNSLPRLLQEVETGRSTIIITRRGKPVARLVPYADDKKHPNKRDILKQFDEIRNNIKGEVDIKAYIAEGRNR
ncbi:MAG: type II toxin-antitoxin system prevent-host-death family antitoxin [Candidatus Aminicenantes bacterium]|nr:type II toxin-antitoxin system prevent-host-death family antitoxin [Candidatus Aminicenantes bacterium]